MSNTRSQLAQRLREARENAGLSLRQAAARLNLNQSFLLELEDGLREPRSEDMSRFADLYKVALAWLSAEGSQGGQSEEDVKYAARELARMKPNDLQRVLEVLTSTPTTKGTATS